jgi:ribosomal protein S18 acetylase RimI-like enzyme
MTHRWLRGLTARPTPSDATAVHITHGIARDIPEIGALYTSAEWSPPGGIRKRDNYLLARRHRKLAGVLMYWLEEPDAPLHHAPAVVYANDHRLWVSEIVVATDAQRCGIGQALMAAAAHVAAAEGVPYIRTCPSRGGGVQEQHGRIAFFAACGMTEVQTMEGHLEMIGRTEDVVTALA